MYDSLNNGIVTNAIAIHIMFYMKTFKYKGTIEGTNRMWKVDSHQEDIGYTLCYQQVQNNHFHKLEVIMMDLHTCVQGGRSHRHHHC